MIRKQSRRAAFNPIPVPYYCCDSLGRKDILEVVELAEHLRRPQRAFPSEISDREQSPMFPPGALRYASRNSPVNGLFRDEQLLINYPASKTELTQGRDCCFTELAGTR